MSEAETTPAKLGDAITEAQAAARMLKGGVALLDDFLDDHEMNGKLGGWFIAAGLKTQVQRLRECLEEAEKIEIRLPSTSVNPPAKPAKKDGLAHAPDLPADRIPALQKAFGVEAAEHPQDDRGDTCGSCVGPHGMGGCGMSKVSTAKGVATAGDIEIGLNEAADALREIKEILDSDGELPRRVLHLAIEAAYERVDAASLWLDNLPLRRSTELEDPVA